MVEEIEISSGKKVIDFDAFNQDIVKDESKKPETKTSVSSKKNKDILDRYLNKSLESQIKGEKKKERVSQKSDEEIQRHAEIMLKINRYLNNENFKKYLETNGFKNLKLESMTIEELNTKLIQIKTAVGNKNTTSFLKGSMVIAIKTVESITQAPKLKNHFDLDGFYDSIIKNNNQEFDDIMAELELEYGMITSLSAEKRLALLLLKSGVTVMAQNKIKRRMQQKTEIQNVSLNETLNTQTNNNIETERII